MRIFLASSNAHKLRELDAMLRGVGGFEVFGADAAGDWPPVIESADDFAGNAAIKVEAFRSVLRARGIEGQALALADDSGICIDALNGGPGVRSARFSGPDATDEANNARLVLSMQSLGIEASRAQYRCALALAWVAGGPVTIKDGVCEGEIRIARRGSGGFGYDPHFWIDARRQTFAELSAEAKAARSHRGMALRAMLPVIVGSLPDSLPTSGV